MSPEQLVVLALLAAAFAAGWVARGGDRERGAPDEPAEPGEPPADDHLELATTAYAAAADAWLDGHPPDGTLTVFEATRTRVTAPPEAVEALADAAEVFERYRAGHPMTGADSARLGDVEERLGLDP